MIRPFLARPAPHSGSDGPRKMRAGLLDQACSVTTLTMLIKQRWHTGYGGGRKLASCNKEICGIAFAQCVVPPSCDCGIGGCTRTRSGLSFVAKLSDFLLLQSDCLLPASVRQDPAENHHTSRHAVLLTAVYKPACLST